MDSVRTNSREGDIKERTSEREERGTYRLKPPASTTAIDAFIGDEEQTGKLRRKKETREKG